MRACLLHAAYAFYQTHLYLEKAPLCMFPGTPMTPLAALMSPTLPMRMHAFLQGACVAASGHPSGRGQPQESAEAQQMRSQCNGCCVAMSSRRLRWRGCRKIFKDIRSAVPMLSDAAAGRPSGTSPRLSWRRRSGSGRSTAAAGLHARPPSSSQPSFSSLTSSAPLPRV